MSKTMKVMMMMKKTKIGAKIHHKSCDSAVDPLMGSVTLNTLNSVWCLSCIEGQSRASFTIISTSVYGNDSQSRGGFPPHRMKCRAVQASQKQPETSDYEVLKDLLADARPL